MTKRDCRAGNRFASFLPKLAIFVALLALPLRGAELSELESETDKWIESRLKLAEERARWKTEKPLLEGSIQVLTTEGKALEEAIESNQLAADLYTTGREKSQGSIAQRRAALELMAERLNGFDAQLRALYARLPEPLQNEVAPMMRKVAAEIEGEPVSVATRAQSLISALTTIDQFNNALNLKHQIRPREGGGSIDVRVLYWGLAAGFAVDNPGTKAWTLAPSDSGWVWQDRSEDAGAIKTLIDIYEKKGEPALVPLNVSIK